MNLFGKDWFDRLRRFVRRTETELVGSKQRATVDPLPVRWQWYEVTDAGPDSEKDYVDERYWLIRAELTNSDSDATSKLTEDSIPDTDDRFKHITATNMAEWPVGSHTVEVGTLVHVRVAYGPQSAETPRFWFVHGEGTDQLYYLGGYFNAAGSILSHAIALQSGSRWYDCNYGDYPWFGTQDFVRQSVVWNDEIYAVGKFKVNVTVNTSPPTLDSHFSYDETNFAKWDSANEEWVDVGGASTNLLLDDAYCLIEYGGNLLIGGSGNTTFVTGVRQWNGSAFSNVGTLGNDFGAVYALREWNGSLYAAGDTNGTENGFAVLSGGAWAQIAGGTNGIVYALEAHDDGTGEKLYLGGAFTQADSVNRRLIARYNGSAIESVWPRTASNAGFNSSSSDSVRALASYGGRLWLGGVALSPGTLIAIYDGQRISAANFSLIHHSIGGSAPAAIVNALRVYDDPTTSQSTLLVGGEFYYVRQKTTGSDIPFVGRYDAFEGSWTTVSDTDLDGSVYEQVVYDSVLYAVGLFEKAGAADCKYFAKLTSGSFSQAGQVNGPCYCGYALNDGSNDVLLVGGRFSQINGADAASSIFRLNGTTLDAPFDVELGGGPGMVKRIRGDYICGAFDAVDGVTTLGAAKVTWSGGTPTATMLIDTLTGGDAIINDICTDGTYLYVAGSFSTIGNSGVATPVSAANCARMLLSTGEWFAMSTGLSGRGLACDVFGSDVIFSMDAAAWLRSWNGTTFGLVLDSGASAGPPSSTANTRAPQMVRVIGSDLYVDYQGGTGNRNRLAKLPSGGEWEAIGGGNPVSVTAGIFDAPIRSVILFDSGSGSQVHAAGDFYQIGEDTGDQTLPRCCICKVTRAGYTQPFYGGVGGKILDAAVSGSTNYVSGIDILTDAPGLTGQSVAVVGHFSMANLETANGVSVVSSRRGMTGLGLGLRYRSASAGLAYTGARDILLGSDGWHYIAGAFDEGMNAPADGASAPVGVASTGVIAHDGAEYQALKAEATEAVSNLSESQTDDEDATGTTWVASQFTTAGVAMTLRSVTLRLHNPGGSAVRVGAALHTDASGDPTDIIQSFTGTTEVAAGATVNVTFGADYALGTSTPYWIVLRAESGTIRWLATSSNNSTSAFSWTIGDDSKSSTDSGGTWSSGLGYVGMFSAAAVAEDASIGDGYCLAEYGTDGNGDPQIMLGHTNTISLWDWEDETWTDLFTNVDTGTITPLFYRFAKLGSDWYVCGAFQIDTVGDATFAKFDGTDEWNKVTPPTGVTTVYDIVVGDIGAGTKMYISCQVSGSENCVYSYDGSTFTVIGPTGTGTGALYGSALGLAIVDFGSGPTLAVMGGTISATVQQMCIYDTGAATWSGTGEYSLLGQVSNVDSVVGGARLIPSGLRIAGLITDNPDVGNVVIDCVAEYNPTDGWRRVAGVYGCNEQVNVAAD